jgi:transketolase
MTSLRKAFADSMLKLGDIDKNLVVIVGDISHGILKPFRETYPDRYFNIGISEPAMVNVAAGLSAQGLNPVVHTIAPFLIERSYEQIKLDFAYQDLGVNLISVGSAFDYSKLGCSHHCYSDYSLMAQFQNSKVFFPGSSIEFETLFEKVYLNKEINYFRLTEFPHGVHFDRDQIEVGKAITAKTGTDLTIVTTGSPLRQVMEAEAILVEMGHSVEVIYHHTLKPFDSEVVVGSALKTRKVITFEEISRQDGLFNLVNGAIAGKFEYSIKQIAINDFVRPYGSYKDLCEHAGLSTQNLVETALNFLG